MKFKLHIHMKLKATWIDYNYIAPIYFFRQQKILHEPVYSDTKCTYNIPAIHPKTVSLCYHPDIL